MKKARKKPKVKLKKYDSIAVKTCLNSKTKNTLDVCFPFGEIDDSEFRSLFSSKCLTEDLFSSLSNSDMNNETFAENELDENLNPIPVKYYLSSQFNESTDNTVATNLSMIHFNARSMFQNFDQIHTYLSTIKHRFSLIGISETWINSSSPAPFSLEGYEFIHVDRPTGRGGGVGLFVREDITFKICEFTEQCDGVDSLCIEINCKSSKNIIVGIIYRQPKSAISAFTPFFEKLINNENIKNKRAYLMGDFNIDMSKKIESPSILDFINITVSSGFYPLIDKPTRVSTRSATTIDNIFTNVYNSSTLSGILLTEITDHFPIFHISHSSVDKKHKEKPHTYRKINIESLDTLNADLENADWSKVYHEHDPERAYDLFCEIFIELYNKHLPVQTNKSGKRQSKKPWVTRELLKLIDKKNRCYKRYITSPLDTNYVKYKKLRNKVTSSLRRAKKDYYFKKFDSIKHNSKLTWKLINTVLGKQKVTPNREQIFTHNDAVINNPSEIAESFNEYFVQIGSNISSSLGNINDKEFHTFMNKPISYTLFFKPATKEEILSIGKSLKSGKSSGFDDISPTVVKHVLPSIAEPFIHICNSSLSTGIVPSKMKISKVTPVFKKDDPRLFTNYRPISILPCFSKLLEKLVFIRLYNFLLKHNLLHDSQYGFRQNFSTDMAIIELQDRIIRELNNGKEVLAVFMDLSKAFDALSHEILLQKLPYYGVRGVCYNWFVSYLSNRQQFTVYDSQNSSLSTTNTGVPQGSILGPLLFLIYINDIVNSCQEPNFILYADDTSLLASHNNLNALIESTNKNLAQVSKWFKCNKLSLNVSKTQCVLFKRVGVQYKLENLTLKIDTIPLKFHDSVQFLGVVLNSKLSWNDHISSVCVRVSRFIGILSRLKYELPCNILFTLYNAYILSYLSYCNSIWGNTYSCHLEQLFLLQKKAIRICTKSDYRAHTTKLFNSLHTLKLQDLNKLQIGSLMQRYHTKTLSPYLMNMFTVNSNIHSHNTRSSNRFHRWNYSNDKSKYSIRHTGPALWNNLDLRNFNTQFNNTFKRKYKNFMINKY